MYSDQVLLPCTSQGLHKNTNKFTILQVALQGAQTRAQNKAIKDYCILICG